MTKKLITNGIARAFEERFSQTLNLRSQGVFDTVPPAHSFYAEFSGLHEPARPLEDLCLAPGAVIASTALLAEHLGNSRSSPYRIRRERSTPSSIRHTYYVPSIDYEMHFDALQQLMGMRRVLKVLERSSVLCPLASVLISAAIAVHKLAAPFKGRSWEECNHLSDLQMQRNLIAERVSKTLSLPLHKAEMLAWNRKHNEDKKRFIEACGQLLARNECQLLRGEFQLSSKLNVRHKQSAKEIQLTLDKFRETLATRLDLTSCVLHVDPYLDISTNWQLPWSCLVTIESNGGSHIRNLIYDAWKSTVPQGWTQDSRASDAWSSEYRLITDEQVMLDSVELQVVKASIFHFDTLLVADTRLLTLSQSIDTPSVWQSSRFDSDSTPPTAWIRTDRQVSNNQGR